mgnify:CR=1 FL=1
MSQAASEVTWVVRLLEELGVTSLKPITLYCDNQSAINIGKNPVFHERTKHIEIDCHFTRDKILEGLLQLSYMPTNEQLADILTKILPSPQQNILLSKLGMVSHPSNTTTKVCFCNRQKCYDSQWKRCNRSIATIFQPLPLMGVALGLPQHFPLLRQQFL